eukprot:6383838-Pyramimonas_sp.AAC.1
MLQDWNGARSREKLRNKGRETTALELAPTRQHGNGKETVLSFAGPSREGFTLAQSDQSELTPSSPSLTPSLCRPSSRASAGKPTWGPTPS